MSTFKSTPIKNKYILVTGGAGFIGSHTVLQLLNNGHEVVIVDNLCNSCEESLRRVEIISGKKVHFHLVDILDKENLNKVFDKYDIWAVIHFAGLKSVFESVKYPERYMKNNVEGTRVLLECMNEHNVNNIVFSSSATLYGGSDQMDNITEECGIAPINPYGESKLRAEQVITENCKKNKKCQAVLLRYFNPIGAHCTGLIGENPKDIPNNLLPYVCQTLVGRLPYLNVFGNDYPTRDGTGVRDFIHVVDLADGHLAALEKLKNNQEERERKSQMEIRNKKINSKKDFPCINEEEKENTDMNSNQIRNTRNEVNEIRNNTIVSNNTSTNSINVSNNGNLNGMVNGNTNTNANANGIINVNKNNNKTIKVEKGKNEKEMKREREREEEEEVSLKERVLIYNMGTGTGYSVMEIVESMRKASGKDVPYKIAPRRAGDAAQVVANPQKANKELLWKSRFNVKQMCIDAWKWQSQNPEGYEKLTPIAEKLLNEYLQN